jgi:predicted metallopeptidase
MKQLRRGPKSLKFDWKPAPDIKRRVKVLLKSLEMDWVKPDRIFFYRSDGSKSRAYARTWGLPKIWQDALGVTPSYIIEVISKYFDGLPERDQDKILLHELTHIPKNFSGALIPHIRRGKRNFHRQVDSLIEKYFLNKR